MIKKSLWKIRKKEEDISKNRALWTVVAKNGIGMREGSSPNQLVFGKNPILSNLMEKNTSSSLERMERRIFEKYFNAIHKTKNGTYTNGE